MTFLGVVRSLGLAYTKVQAWGASDFEMQGCAAKWSLALVRGQKGACRKMREWAMQTEAAQNVYKYQSTEVPSLGQKCRNKLKVRWACFTWGRWKRPEWSKMFRHWLRCWTTGLSFSERARRRTGG